MWVEAASPMLSSGLRRKGVRLLDDRPLTCPASDEAVAASAETRVVAAEAEGAASGRRAELGVGAAPERGLDSGATG